MAATRTHITRRAPRPYGQVSATLPPVRVAPRILEEIREAAQRADTNTSDAVRQILGQWVAGQEQEKGSGQP